MALIIFLVTAAFAAISFVSNQSPKVIFNPLYTYYFFVFGFIRHNLFIFAVGFGGLTLVLALMIRKFIPGIIKAVEVTLISLLLSALMIFFIAMIELNILAIIININPGIVGVVTDKELIVKTLTQAHRSPEIITSDPDGFKELSAVATASTGKGNYYGSFILGKIPKFLVFPIRKSDFSLLLIDNTLIVGNISTEDLQTISPLIAYQMVKQIFASRPIKYYPKVSILSDTDYFKFNQEETNKKLTKIDSEALDLQQKIMTYQPNIKTDQVLVSDRQNILDKIYRQRETEYQNCLSISKHTEIYCKDQLPGWDEKITQANQNLNDEKSILNADQKLLKDNQSYLDILAAQKSLIKSMEKNVNQEYGQFVPEKLINMALNSYSQERIADYFSALTHEYMHYTSYISDKIFLPDPFFEEGLTEYFARKAINNNLQVSTNVGYPVIVKIITQMSKRITDSDLAEIYFSKDQSKLITILDRVYGDNFYKNNRILFTLLQFTSDEIQALKMANTIMENIDGPQLKISDLISTSSNY